jgi:hypothetical protein
MILTAPVPTRLTRFEINQTFAPYNTSEFFKPEVLQAWNELLPGTSHSLPVPYSYPLTFPSRHGLPTHP